MIVGRLGNPSSESLNSKRLNFTLTLKTRRLEFKLSLEGFPTWQVHRFTVTGLNTHRSQGCRRAPMKAGSRKERLDKLLVARGLAETRAKAQALILAGQVFSGAERLDKAGHLVPGDLPLTVRETMPYVSRGGLKLAAALDRFQEDVAGRICLDIGASTGGFTDCLLQRGAARVVALDVGHGQLDWKLRQDARVEVRENINARYLAPADFDCRFQVVVADVSFISLRKILPVIRPLSEAGAVVLTLIKPQFEVGREEVGKGGIVRDEAAQQRAVEAIVAAANALEMRTRGVMESPIRGADGNREFLACFDLP
jgi:23S rRNA (cytidine1920-2'-O)/16S rRNA (cytidine1409-2'-O)-methyltransferase